jgi:hypothetical protein
MSSAAKKSRREESRRHDDKLGEYTEREVTNFLTSRELGRVRATERGARDRKYSAAITKITVPRDLDIPLNFWQRYNLKTVTEIDGSRSNITDADLQYVAQHCPNLTTLDLGWCQDRITDAGVVALAQGCPQLSTLNLGDCDQITDASVIALSQWCPQLSSLDLCWLEKITDVALIALSQGSPQLSFLDLERCYMITDEGIIALAQGCPELATLSLYNCDQLTDGSIIALAGCRKLKKLDLRYTELGVFDDWEKLIYNAQSFFDTEVRNKGLGLSSGASSAFGGGESKSGNFLELHQMAEYLRLRF